MAELGGDSMLYPRQMQGERLLVYFDVHRTINVLFVYLLYHKRTGSAALSRKLAKATDTRTQ
jgi:hypothetical protein